MNHNFPGKIRGSLNEIKIIKELTLGSDYFFAQLFGSPLLWDIGL
jgi:hypothetical protein